jgi:gallate dioxygenase
VSHYGLNRFLYDLREPAARAAYAADPDAFAGGYELTGAERALVDARDWNGLFAAGGNLYLLPNLGKAAGVSFPEMGARYRGETPAEWERALEEQNRRIAPFALLHVEEERNG